jgi:hypothetical protein
MKMTSPEQSAQLNRMVNRWLDEMAGEDAPALLRAMQRRGDIQFSLDADGALMVRLAVA